MRNKPNYLLPDTPKRKSQRQEKRLAKEGFLVPASGALWNLKGDVSFKDFLVEAKRTDKKSISVKKGWLTKIFEEAINEGKTPGIEIEIQDFRIQGIVVRNCISNSKPEK